MVRMRNRPLSVSIGEIKQLREINFFPLAERVEARKELVQLEQEGEIIRKNFESELKIIYAATLLTGDPSGVHKFIESYPVYKKTEIKKLQWQHCRIYTQLCFTGRVHWSIFWNKTNRFIKMVFCKVPSVSPVFPLVGGFL